MRKALGFVLFLFVFFLLNGCASQNNEVVVTWLDADGTVIETMKVEIGVLPEFDLPTDTDAWDYQEWTPVIEPVTEDVSYTAVRELNNSFFIGNVFQIIVYDLGHIPIGTGTGFIFNEQGWFITNSHVMSGGYFAEAIFDIPDNENNMSHIKLPINDVLHIDNDKDIFIGKLSDYSVVGDEYYQEFTFTTDYEVGDNTYSVGYPNSSVDLQVHQGEIISDISSLYDKVYTGVRYIGSTSFIAPGSSGGILINNELEVLGITTISLNDDEGNFDLGGSVESFNFMNNLTNLRTFDLVDYIETQYPDEKYFIDFFIEAMNSTDTTKTQYDSFTRYTYSWLDEGVNNNGYAFTYEQILDIDSDMYIHYYSEYYWENGDRRIIKLFGYFSPTNGLSNLIYQFEYSWGSGGYYTVLSTDINYSENINLTLNRYTTTSSYGFSVTESNIEYAKEQFNYVYKWLDDWIH